MPEIAITDMTAADLPCVLDLARQLGYPDTLEALAARFRMISPLERHTLATARTPDGGIVGWMHLCVHSSLEAPASARISGIVVDEAWRGRGVGRLLVAYAEDWARARRLDRVTLRSQKDRAGAHAFYVGRGFTATKMSVVFEKDLG